MDLWQMGALELGQLIGTGDVSAREVTQAHLDRIAEVNPAINAVVEVRADEALEQARQADREIRAGDRRGPLHGVPITVKANIDMAGWATTNGVVALADAVSPVDSPHLGRLRAAGAVVIGRTNMPDFGFRWHTDNALYGATRNPWNPTRTPGGSGGGEAAAVATGCVPLGLGNDYGGSLRGPAQACGVASLRTTPGRLASTHVTSPAEYPPTLQLFASQGAMARHVADLRAAFEAMSGDDPADPWSTAMPAAGSPAPRRVAVTVDPGGQGVDPSVAEGVRRAAAALADAGYEVVEVEPPQIEAAAAMWLSLVATECRLNPPQWSQMVCEQEQRFLDSFLRVAPELDLAGYVWQLGDRARVARAWAQFQRDYPVVLGPVTTREPFPVGADLSGDEAVAEIVTASRLMVAVNALALPAAVVPVGEANGLPQAVQLIAPRCREDLSLDAAEAVERHLGALTPIAPRAAATVGAR